MKKLLAVLLAFALIFAFAACNQQEAGEEAAGEGQAVNIGILALNGISAEDLDQWWDAAAPAAEGYSRHTAFYDDMTSMLLGLDNGDVSLIATNRLTAQYIAASVPDTYTMTETGNSIAYSFALAEGETELLDTLNTALDALEAEGRLSILEARYLENCDPAGMPAPAELPRFEGADTLRVVVTGDLPPMDYMTAEGQAAGYNIALLSAIAEKAQINFELVSANSASRALMINSGKADLIFWCATTYEGDEQLNSNDLPAGMAMTRPYVFIPCVGLMLTEAGAE